MGATIRSKKTERQTKAATSNEKEWRYGAMHSVPDSRLARRSFENGDSIDLPIELAIIAASE